jgi:Ran GTPase-activating protein (RanGAP) involved in mRNA processing and transport
MNPAQHMSGQTFNLFLEGLRLASESSWQGPACLDLMQSVTLSCDNNLRNLLHVLPHFRILTHLNLSFCHLRPLGAAQLSLALQTCSALQHLELCGNNLTPAGAKALAHTLRHTPDMTHLHLKTNFIDADGRNSLSAQISGFLEKSQYYGKCPPD